MDNKIIPMGYITGAFGILGFVRVKPSTSSVNFLSRYKKLQVLLNNKWQTYTVEKTSVANNYIQIKFAEVSDRDMASTLRGATVGVWRNELPQTDTDEFYFVDLIGLNVINHRSETIGMVQDVFETGSNAVLIVKNEKNEYLIPFVKNYILDINFDNKTIVADWELDFLI